jgi:putative ABC transport system substrate-binding protein
MKNMFNKIKDNYKKIISLALVLMLSLGIVGCSSDNGSKGSNQDIDKVFKIGLTQYAPHPSLDNIREGFIQGLKEEG